MNGSAGRYFQIFELEKQSISIKLIQSKACKTQSVVRIAVELDMAITLDRTRFAKLNTKTDNWICRFFLMSRICHEISLFITEDEVTKAANIWRDHLNKLDEPLRHFFIKGTRQNMRPPCKVFKATHCLMTMSHQLAYLPLNYLRVV